MKYADSSPFGRREYELAPPVLRAKGRRSLAGDFDVSIELSELSPHYERLRIPRPLLKPGAWIAAVGLVVTVLFGEVPPFPSYPYLSWIAVSILIAGFAMCLLSLKKVQAVQFRSPAGVGMLIVFDSGPQRSQFEPFVEAVREAIVSAKERKQG